MDGAAYRGKPSGGAAIGSPALSHKQSENANPANPAPPVFTRSWFSASCRRLRPRRTWANAGQHPETPPSAVRKRESRESGAPRFHQILVFGLLPPSIFCSKCSLAYSVAMVERLRFPMQLKGEAEVGVNRGSERTFLPPTPGCRTGTGRSPNFPNTPRRNRDRGAWNSNSPGSYRSRYR